uniref:Uncharacterized protein n=1 Tax=Anguilla anguilla TaxID=7936 RepID=A0A0E9WJS6_ANGAN
MQFEIALFLCTYLKTAALFILHILVPLRECLY